MAAFANSLPLFFFATLLFSVQTLAREGRFSGMVTVESTETTKPTTVNKVVEVKEEEQPSFLPQTSENAPYGLYGRQADLDASPSTTTTTTTTQKYAQPQYQHQKEVATFDNNKNRYFSNMETFETKEESVPTTTTEPEFYGTGDRKNYAAELQGIDGYAKGAESYGGNGYYYSPKKGGSSSYYNSEKQGMSDTRFLENGRYSYVPNRERAPATYNYGAAPYRRAPEYYNNEGYYSGSTERFYDKYYKNTRPGFNREEQILHDEDFEFDP